MKQSSFSKFNIKNWQYFVVYNKFTSLLVVSLTAIIALSAWISFERMISVRHKSRLQTRIAQIEMTLQDRMNAYVDVLIHTRGMFMVSGRPTVPRFEAYVRGIDFKNRFKGVHTLGYSEIVYKSELPKLAENVDRRYGVKNLKIWPQSDREIYSAVVMLSPMSEKRLKNIGFDMFSEPTRSRAIRSAIDSGKPMMSDKVTLLSEMGLGTKRTAFIIYLPVYDTIEVPTTVEERREKVVGVIYGSFVAKDFFNGILGMPNPDGEDINFTVTMPNAQADSIDHLYKRFEDEQTPIMALTSKDTMSVLNQKWHIDFETRSRFINTSEWVLPKAVGLASLFFAALVFYIINTIRTHVEVQDKNRKLIQEAEAKSRRQSDIQRQLNEMSQYISAEIDFDELLKRVVLLAQFLTKAKFSSVLYRTKDGEGEIFLPYASEEYVQDLVNFDSYDMKSLVSLFSGTHAISSEDVEHHNASQLIRPTSPYKKWLALPIFSRMGQLKAILLLADDEKIVSDDDVLILLQGLAAQISIGIENALLFKKAEEGSRAKSFFLANMSHEIRTPLGAIIGFSELIAKPEFNEQQRREFMVNISKNGEQLTRIIDDILDISKVEAGKVIIEKKPVHLAPLLYQIQSLMGLRAKEKNIQFLIQTEGMLPEEFMTDEIRLKQILMNVIGNAIKFTDTGSVTLICKMFDPDGKDQYLDFFINDTGCGIPELTQKVLFRPFSQADSSLTRKHGGTGLGLSLSKRLAEQLGGDLLLLESKQGEGSSFMLRIRCKAPQGLRQLDTSLTLKKQNESHPLRQAGLKGMNILLVEDSEDNQEIFRYYLESAGAKVDLVEDGLSAVEKATEKTFDIILMDIQVPGIDGKEATRRIRSQGYGRPIVALTAHAMVEERQSCIEAGCDGQITKPVTGDQLITEVTNYLIEGEA